MGEDERDYFQLQNDLERAEAEVARLRAAEAAYLEAHRDDPALWGGAEAGPFLARGRFGATITVRLSPAEADALRDWARATRRSYSAIVREAVQRALARPALLVLDANESQTTITS